GGETDEEEGERRPEVAPEARQRQEGELQADVLAEGEREGAPGRGAAPGARVDGLGDGEQRPDRDRRRMEVVVDAAADRGHEVDGQRGRGGGSGRQVAAGEGVRREDRGRGAERLRGEEEVRHRTDAAGERERGE